MAANANTAALLDADIITFTSTVPPPPYPGNELSSLNSQYDLTPTPHIQNRPRLPEHRRNPHLRSREIILPLIRDLTSVSARGCHYRQIPDDCKRWAGDRSRAHQDCYRKLFLVREHCAECWEPTQHAFILRRYDTNAISLTTMFKVAFPGATDEEEKKEMDWVCQGH